MKTLWVVGGGIEAVPSIQRAKAMGLFVIVSDGSPKAPGFAYADQGIVVSTYDAAGTALAAAVRMYAHPIDGVIALVADVPVTVATVAAAIGRPGLPIDVAQLGADKMAMKARLEDMNIPTAKGSEITKPSQLLAFLESAKKDVIVKPVDSRGARGVVRVKYGHPTTIDFVVRAFNRAQAQSPKRRVLVEEWLPGPQVSTETILLDGDISRTFMLDRNYDRLDEFAPYVIEDGATGPSRLHWDDQLRVLRLVSEAARRLWGEPNQCPVTFKGDVVLTDHGPALIEFALRLSGGYMSSYLIPLMTGVQFVDAAITAALGEQVQIDQVSLMTHTHVAIRYDIPPGATCHPDRKGHGIGTGPTRADAILNAVASIEVEV